MTNINEVKEILNRKILEEKSGERTIDLPPLVYKENKFSVVSLFCGAGGLDLGVEWAGIEAGVGRRVSISQKENFESLRDENVLHTIYAVDFFQEAISTYSKHFKDTVVHKADIGKIKNFPKADLYTFGFPCPGFSAAGPRLVDDERNFEYIHCCRALLQAQPKVFIAENVKGLMTLGGGEPYKQIKEDFTAAGYNIYTKLLDSRDYGVPQIRERVIMVGVRKDLDFVYNFPKPGYGEGAGLKPYTSIKRAIADLYFEPGWYYEGTYSTQYMGRNRKKNWNQQSFTIQASGRQAPMHPAGEPMVKIDSNHWKFARGAEYERRLSVKEAARIQTFPDWFEFDYGNEDVSHNTKVNKMFKQIGNAVPVVMAKAIAKPIVEFLCELKENELKSEDGVILPGKAKEQKYELPVLAISSSESEISSNGTCEQLSIDNAVIIEECEQNFIDEKLSIENYEEINMAVQDETPLINNEEEINLIDRFGQFAFDF